METTASTQVPGDATSRFPPFEADSFASQILWFAIAFAALYLIIARLAVPQIGGIIEARSRRIADDLAEAASLREQSEAALAAYEKALADARSRAQALASEARDTLNAEAEETRRKLEAELAAKLADADRAIAATKTAAMANIEAVATDTAGAIVERLIGTAPAPAAVQAAVGDALKRGRAG